MALSLYRKYRPQTFEDVVGQSHIEQTLINAVERDETAQAYLFCGPRGTGKTTTARLLAKALLCDAGPTPTPDGTCPQCVQIAAGTHPDVYELDAASRTGVENVREEIISRVQFAPTQGRKKVYIIDEVHMLSVAAFNALLKTLEEPPEHVVFILCTTDPHKVPDTIQSRCQRFDFHRLSIDEIVSYLQRICEGEGFEYEPEALELLAAKSAGGMRDATTMLEQVAVYAQGKITAEAAASQLGQMDTAALFEIAGHIADRDSAASFAWLADLCERGMDLSQFARDLATHLRNLYVTALTGGDDGIVPCTAAELPKYQEQAAAFGGVERLSRALGICGDLVNELRNSSDPRLSVEIAFTRLCRADSDLTLAGLAERVEALEGGSVAAGVAVATPATPATPPQKQAPSSEARPQTEDEAPHKAADPEPPAAEPTPAASEPPADTAEEDSRQDQPATLSADMTPARLWAAVLTEVKREDVSASALLGGVDFGPSDDGFRLVFPEDGEFAMRTFVGGDAADLVVQALSRHCSTDGLLSLYLKGKTSQPPYRSLPFGADYVSAEAATSAPDSQPSPQPEPAPTETAAAADVAEEAPAPAEPAISDAEAGSIAASEDTADTQPAPAEAAPEAEPEASDGQAPSELDDLLSAFGGGVKIEEVDD
ncbi:MAG: DNA polymerase III subunit gamma/tau [Coriobacteriaceae bacterium]|nr:DNA polymerase III subunit gamma/tau [Coriobacteriaceae bacterium]